MTKTELHPVIAELLRTKFNEDDRICSNVPAYRSLFKDFIRIVSCNDAEPLTVQEIELSPGEAQVPGFRIRIYQNDLTELKPVLVYFHGGNWIAGDIQSCDAICSALAAESDYAVISVDYALAPEYCYPIPLYQGIEVID